MSSETGDTNDESDGFWREFIEDLESGNLNSALQEPVARRPSLLGRSILRDRTAETLRATLVQVLAAIPCVEAALLLQRLADEIEHGIRPAVARFVAGVTPYLASATPPTPNGDAE